MNVSALLNAIIARANALEHLATEQRNEAEQLRNLIFGAPEVEAEPDAEPEPAPVPAEAPKPRPQPAAVLPKAPFIPKQPPLQEIKDLAAEVGVDVSDLFPAGGTKPTKATKSAAMARIFKAKKDAAEMARLVEQDEADKAALLNSDIGTDEEEDIDLGDLGD